MDQKVKQKVSDRMETAIDHLRKELSGVRTGRASLALLDGIAVESYGSTMKLEQVATMSIPESRQIIIQPWDVTLVPAIEKAILSSSLGLTPTHDGKVLRITIPPLTEERRKDLVRIVKKIGEDSRVVVRSHRRDANEELKKLEKNGDFSKDILRRSQDEIQKVTDDIIHKVDEIIANKEGEVLER